MANIETISKSIEKNKEKIAELQKKLRNLEIQKKNAENEEFYKVVKAINLPINEIMVILKAYEDEDDDPILEEEETEKEQEEPKPFKEKQEQVKKSYGGECGH